MHSPGVAATEWAAVTTSTARTMPTSRRGRRRRKPRRGCQSCGLPLGSVQMTQTAKLADAQNFRHDDEGTRKFEGARPLNSDAALIARMCGSQRPSLAPLLGFRSRSGAASWEAWTLAICPKAHGHAGCQIMAWLTQRALPSRLDTASAAAITSAAKAFRFPFLTRVEGPEMPIAATMPPSLRIGTATPHTVSRHSPRLTA